MSQNEKLIQKFKTKPLDFRWDELEKLLSHFGYEQLKTGGSRVKFIHSKCPVIFLNKPHPSQILKRYQMQYLFEFLTNEGIL